MTDRTVQVNGYDLLDADDDRERAVRGFAIATGCPPIRRLLQRGLERDDAVLFLELDDGRTVKLGSIDRLWSQTEFHKTVSVAVIAPLALVKADSWRTLVAALLAHGRDVEEHGGSDRETVEEWLRLYLSRSSVATRDQAAGGREPFVEDGDQHISADHFARFVRMQVGEQVKRRDLQHMLEAAGFTSTQVAYYRDEKRTQRAVARYMRGPEIQ